MEVIGDGVAVNLRKRAFLGADASGKVAPVVDGQGQVSRSGFANGFAVVPGLGQCEHVEVVFHALGDLVHDDGALRWTCVPPTLSCGVRCIKGKFDVLRCGPGNFAKRSSSDGCGVFKVLARRGLDPLSANVVAITGAEAHMFLSLIHI